MKMTSERTASASAGIPVVSTEPMAPRLAWAAGASAALRSAAKTDDAVGFWQAYRNAVLPHRDASSGLPPGMCLWTLPSEDPLARLARDVFLPCPRRSGSRSAMKVRRTPGEAIGSLISRLTQGASSWRPAEFVTAGELLLAVGHKLEPSAAWSLWRRLAEEAMKPPPSAGDEYPDQLLMRTGEVPLLVGCLVEPLRIGKKLRDSGRRSLAQELYHRTDRDGTPHAEVVSRMAAWLAPLIRATLWADMFRYPLWEEEDRRRIALVLERAIPLSRPDGRLAMSNGCDVDALPALTVAAKTFSLAEPAQKLLRTLKTAPTVRTLRKRFSGGVRTMPSAQSDWARFAILRSDWHPDADCLAIAHHQPIPQIDVAAFGRPVVHGAWGWDLRIGDAHIEPAAEWSCSCWMSDPDADYLELQMTGPGGLRVERQVLLSRNEHFLLLADCVRGCRSVAKGAGAVAEEQRIHLRSRLPLAEGVTAHMETATREIRLKAGKQTIRVFPLALADDRVQSTPHECTVEDRHVVLHQIGAGNGLYAPLVLDWRPTRSRKPALWRTLTVTESAKIVGRDVAAGHRLQIGDFQLLIYRSLAAMKSPRAVLGHHTFHESVIARFLRNGDVEPIMNVDP